MKMQDASRVLAVLLTVAVAGAVLAFKPRAPEVIQAERVELVNRQGTRQAVLSADSLGVVLTLLDARGLGTASFRFNPEPRLTVLGDGRREVAELGAPRPKHLVQ
ncbi:MAG TPA: hypothetical protein VH763_08370 [Gemmatimonadales bacterium]|jgi:hypothetical protein